MSAEPKSPAIADEDAPRPTEEESELDRKLAQYARIGLPVGTVVLAGLAGSTQGPSAAVLVLAGGTLIGVISLLWASVRTLVGETPLSGADAYALGAPRAEEEQKRAVLRALKDLEFEHSVGKISDDDYRELVVKYRAEAKRLLRQIDADAEPRRAQIEALVNRRLRQEGLLEGGHEPEAAPAEASDDGDEEEASPAPKPVSAPLKGKKRKKTKGRAEPARAEASEPEAAEETRICSGCETVNDADAVFCKKCGKRQDKAEEAAKAAAKVEAKTKAEAAAKAPAKAAADAAADEEEDA
jgi:hypothetical protein